VEIISCPLVWASVHAALIPLVEVEEELLQVDSIPNGIQNLILVIEGSDEE
jgi:hypothetical protein